MVTRRSDLSTGATSYREAPQHGLYQGERDVPVEPGGLFIVRSGRVERQITNDRTIDIGVGEFFNEENVLFDAAMTFNVRALENTEVWVIDAEVIGDVPVARRKLV